MKSLTIGSGILLMAALAAFLFKDWALFTKVSGGVGLGLWITAGIISRSFVSGDRIRAGYASEEALDRNRRQETSLKLFLVGLPNVAGTLFFQLLR